ncbi:MAG: HAMP domain-containing histidine kinase, partial [Oscillospiraceae bacterium]|nr:HAMP domain-containing histidine kinase [Oscillospiraceae bacterium]
NYLGIRNTEDYTNEEAQEILTGILENDKDKGMYGWLQFCREEKSYGTLLVITDKTSDQGLLNHLFRLTVIVGSIMLLTLLVIVVILSKWITEPVQTAFRRQKQFVSDAGHELKTPIAVLTANADILQDELGSNKWLEYMQEQINRMNQLVGDLLHLARMDNTSQEYHFEDFDLSLAVAATTLPFESAAFEQHRNLEMDVQPGVYYHGSEQHIRQLCAIFIDNALKYSNENGIIKVTLLKRGEQQILEFYNTGCDISPSETEKIFERFYRGDTARNSQGKNGYGLGLAIAKSIMDIHKIKIQVTCEQGKWIRFLLTL